MQGCEITFFQALPWPVKNGIHISAERKKIEVEVLDFAETKFWAIAGKSLFFKK